MLSQHTHGKITDFGRYKIHFWIKSFKKGKIKEEHILVSKGIPQFTNSPIIVFSMNSITLFH